MMTSTAQIPVTMNQTNGDSVIRVLATADFFMRGGEECAKDATGERHDGFVRRLNLTDDLGEF